MSDPPGRILVTGANGQLGRRLLARLAEAGRPSRAVVRSERAAAVVRAANPPADPTADSGADPAADVVIVDYRDADELARVAAGCDAAVHLVGILKQTRDNRYEDAHEKPAEALATAAAAAGLRRIVSLSILGSRPDADNACLASKGRAEQILLEARTPALILRVPMVIGSDDPASEALRRQATSGTASLVRGGATREQPIDAGDVVAAITAGLDREGLDDIALDLAGPESLSHRELVLRAAAVLGTDVQIRSVPLLFARTFAALAQAFAANPPLTTAMLGVLEHDDVVDPSAACERLGIALTPLDETLRNSFTDAGGMP